VLGTAAAAHPLAMVHRGFLSVYTSRNANSKFNKASARDQASSQYQSSQQYSYISRRIFIFIN
jgi:hypothetical protein